SPRRKPCQTGERRSDMKDTKKPALAGRRTFLKTVALATGNAAQAPALQDPHKENQGGGVGSRPVVPPHAGVQYPRTFTGRQLEMIAFPLGGVAAGSVALGGRGQLRDWEIFNRPDK